MYNISYILYERTEQEDNLYQTHKELFSYKVVGLTTLTENSYTAYIAMSEKVSTAPVPQPEAVMPPPTERFRPSETLPQSIDRIANLINGTDPKRPDADPVAFLQEAKQRAETFSKYYEVPTHKMNDQKRAVFNKWVEQDEAEGGSNHLGKLTDAYAAMWGAIKKDGLPGHDKRHLQEDLKAGLQFRFDVVNSNGTDSYQKLGLIGSWVHDIGRLVEERVQGTPTGGEMGKAHGMMSFAIAKDILDHFTDIPQELRDQIAYSVLNHQTWPPTKEDKAAKPVKYSLIFDEPMPQSVMGSDRLQLVGPEGIMRMWGFDVGESKKLNVTTTVNPERKIKLDSGANTDLAHHMEFYMRNLLPVEVKESPQEANNKVNARADRYRAIVGTYLWLSSTDEIRDQIFAPELGTSGVTAEELKTNKKTPLTPAIWNQIKTVAEGGLDPQTEQRVRARLGGRSVVDLQTLDDESSKQLLFVLAREMISPPNASVTPEEISQINIKLTEVPQGLARARLAEGISYAIVMRETLDAEHEQMMTALLQDAKKFPPQSLERKLAQFVQAHTPKAA